MAEKTIQALGEMAANWFQPGERPAKPDKTTSQDEILDLMSLIRPWQISPQAKIRIGSKHDGGYVVPELACQSNLIVSIGIGHEISFDADLAGRGAKIYQFDHTIAGPPFTHPNMKFFKKGWGVAETSELLTFAQIMDLIDWTGALHPALKFDVEGAEWEALQVMDPNQLARFAVVVGEFHWLEHIGRRETYALVRRAFEKLCAGHVPVHFHVNNYSGLALVRGVPIPKVIELTFLRKDCAVFSGRSHEPIPGALDYPNNLALPDISYAPDLRKAMLAMR